MEDGGPPPFPDPREAWFSPYRGVEFGITFKWLSIGALVYALLLLVAMAGKPGEATWPIVGPSLYLTPLYGLPYVLATINRPGRTRRMLFFLILLPLAHVAANYLAWSYAVANFDPVDSSGDLPRNLLAGALGGVSGSVLTFTLLRIVRLTAPDRSRLPVMVLGAIVLTLAGAVAMAAGLQWTGALHDTSKDAGRAIIWYETVHFPWQLLLGFFLAWAMRKPREPRPRRKRARMARTTDSPSVREARATG